jgi:hypothetical protein
MTVSELISELSFYPPETRVTWLDPDKRWLLPIEIKYLPAQGSAREVDFIAITADTMNDEIEGVARDDRSASGSLRTQPVPLRNILT